jgi:hypothetical protein
MNNNKNLKIIANLVMHNFEVRHNQVTGVKDTTEKILACLIAKFCSGCKDYEIANYFQINQHYMNMSIEDIQIELLLMDKTMQEAIYKMVDHAREIIQIIEPDY